MAQRFISGLIQAADGIGCQGSEIPNFGFEIASSNPDITRQLRISSNVTGFSDETLSAIFAFDNSVRKRVDAAATPTYGIESVFDFAEVVHFSLGSRNFRLDLQETLGMIPEEADVVHDQGNIFLDLRDRSTSDLVEALGQISPESLLFLQKLRSITISTPTCNRAFELECTNEDELTGWETRTLTIQNNGTNMSQPDPKKYFILRHSVEIHTISGAKLSTQAMLAFQILANKDAEIEAQSVYVNLPVADSGFSYLTEADFLSDDGQDSILIKGIATTFLTVVSSLNTANKTMSHPDLRYTWPLFLRASTSTFLKFWTSLRGKIFEALRESPVLESRDEAGSVRVPDQLYYIPHHFRHGGEPLVEAGDRKSLHLSFQYDSILQEVSEMGVQEMTPDVFLEEFESVVRARGELFLQEQSGAWHSKVAKILRDNGCKKRLSCLCIIPLENGSWVHPTEKRVFLRRPGHPPIPEGIDMNFVAHEALQNTERTELIEWLGIEDCKPVDVCQMLMEVNSQPFRKGSLAEKISDTIFLFKFSTADPFHTPSSTADFFEALQQLHLVGSDHQDALGSDLYVDLPGKGFKMSEYSSRLGTSVRMINSEYLEAARELKEESEFIDWLVFRLGLSTIPILLRNGSLTDEFAFFTGEIDVVPKFLEILRDNWDVYSPQFQSISSSGMSLGSLLRSTQVKCKDGIRRSLDKTVLPLPKLLDAGSELPFIDVADPCNAAWLKFAELGVTTKDSVDFYLRQLKGLSSSANNQSLEKSSITVIYQRLGSYAVGASKIILREFRSFPLVFDPHANRWLFLKNCVWKSPKSMKALYAVSNQYSAFELLFRKCCQLRDASIYDAVDEIRNLPNDTIDKISKLPNGTIDKHKALLLTINEYLLHGDSPDAVLPLRKSKIIPVIRCEDPEGRDFMDCDQDQWYIADRTELRDSFEGKVPLLDFTVKESRIMQPLFDALKRGDSRLSEAVQEELCYFGTPQRDTEENAAGFIGRIGCILQLVPSDRRDLLESIFNAVTIWRVEGIRIKRTIKGKRGKDGSGFVAISDPNAPGPIQIYLPGTPLGLAPMLWDPKTMRPLSKFFIDLCGITNPAVRELVPFILMLNPPEIDTLLESANLESECITSEPAPLFTGHRQLQNADFSADISAKCGTPEKVSKAIEAQLAEDELESTDSNSPPRTPPSRRILQPSPGRRRRASSSDSVDVAWESYRDSGIGSSPVNMTELQK